MAITIRLDAKDIGQKIGEVISKPMESISDFWGLLGQVIDRDAILAFRYSGARSGNPAWEPLSSKTIRTPAGTKKIRYGTDLRALPKEELAALRRKWVSTRLGFFRTGEMRGKYGTSKVRRYSENSKPLLASGGFMRSFGVKEIGRNHMTYGTSHEKAKEIMSVRNRQVLFITPMDERNYLRLFRGWYLRGLL